MIVLEKSKAVFLSVAKREMFAGYSTFSEGEYGMKVWLTTMTLKKMIIKIDLCRLY